MARGYPDYEGGKRGVFPVAQWAALEAYDKNFLVTGTNKTYGQSVAADYTVPAGKTLYIVGLSFGIHAYAQADADLNQFGQGEIDISAPALVLGFIGGNGGGEIRLDKPAVFAAGKTFHYIAGCLANHACNLNVTAWGYEI